MDSPASAIAPGASIDPAAMSMTDLSLQLSVHSLLSPTVENQKFNFEPIDTAQSMPCFFDPAYSLTAHTHRQGRLATPPSPREPISPFSMSPSPSNHDTTTSQFAAAINAPGTAITTLATTATGLITPPHSRPLSSSSSSPTHIHSNVHSRKSSNSAHTYLGMSRTTLRVQRQRAVRRQCSTDHVREVQALVARMIERGELCEIVESGEVGLESGHMDVDVVRGKDMKAATGCKMGYRESPTDTDESMHFGEEQDEEDSMTSAVPIFRRSSDWANHQRKDGRRPSAGAVSKKVRIRKHPRRRKGSLSECR